MSNRVALAQVFTLLYRVAARRGILNRRILAGPPGQPGYYFLMHRAQKDNYYGPFINPRMGAIVHSIYAHCPYREAVKKIMFIGWSQAEQLQQQNITTAAGPLFKSPSNLSYGWTGKLSWSKVKARALKMFRDSSIQ